MSIPIVPKSLRSNPKPFFTVVRYIGLSEDFEAIAKITQAQDSYSPKKDPDPIEARIRKRGSSLLGKLGILVPRTGGEAPFPERAPDLGRIEEYYIPAKDMFCYGFIWYPNGKFLPVLPEEIEVVRALRKPDWFAFSEGLHRNRFPFPTINQ